MWERFSFYGMKALLLLYLTKYHLFGDERRLRPARRLRRTGLLHAGDRRRARRPLAGHAQGGGVRRHAAGARATSGMAFEGDAASASAAAWCATRARCAITYLSLALIIMGVGLPQAQHLHHRRQAVRGRTIRAAIPASRCSTPASTSARCSPRWCAATSARPTAGTTASAPPASACWSGWRCSCGARNTCTATPNRAQPALLRERVAGRAARVADLRRRAARRAAGGLADVGGRRTARSRSAAKSRWR